MSRPFPWICRVCGEKAVHQVSEDYSTVLEHDGRRYPTELTDASLYKCQACGATLLLDETRERLAKALHEAAGLLLPEQIRAHRNELGLMQTELAGYLNVSESTVSRWETGAQIQQRAMDTLLRLFFFVPECRERLIQANGKPVEQTLDQRPLPVTIAMAIDASTLLDKMIGEGRLYVRYEPTTFGEGWMYLRNAPTASSNTYGRGNLPIASRAPVREYLEQLEHAERLGKISQKKMTEDA
jgi:putative zinc finger/helix-turn-helix YgiT family protein